MQLKWFWRVSLAVAGLLMTAGPAFADCINASRPDTANVVIVAHTPTLTNCGFTPCSPHLTLDQMFLIDFQAPAGSFYAPDGLGLCKDGADYLLGKMHDAAASLGIDFSWVVGGEALQSGGLFNASNPRAQQNLTNGKGVDLVLQYEGISALIDLNLAAAEALC